jgi:pSer/pThr/pTyr-binding forkhead associated (FHA) protein
MMAMATHTLETPTDADQHETAQLLDLTELRSDPFSLLDFRDRAKAIPAADALPGHYLSLHDGDAAEYLIPLGDSITHIGRASTAGLRFEDVHVSRRHAIMVRYGDHVRVLDDRSSGGTFVNGRRVVATDLLEGDVVRLGPIAFTYVRVR